MYTYIVKRMCSISISAAFLGSYHFFREGGPSVCDGRSPFISGPPPFACREKLWHMSFEGGKF